MHIKKVILPLSLLFIIVFCFFIANNVYANEWENLPPNLENYDIRILENGNYITLPLKSIETENKKALIPLRLILERSGYNVKWDFGKVIINKDSGETVENQVLDFASTKYEYKNIKGNIFIETDYFNNFKDIKIIYDNPTKTIIFKNDHVKKDVIYYDFGTRNMKTSLNKDLEYRLNGGISIPDKDENPLVIILHGAHHINRAENNRYDLGYSYLLKNLCENGYAAVSLNVNMQYSFEDGEPINSERIMNIFNETIKSLKDANNGKIKIDGKDMTDKFDFNNVILIGHSRSGQEIFNLSKESYDDLNIKGLISIAPSRVYEMNYKNIDIPTGIILPELDGDVISLDGQWIFDEFIKNEKLSKTQLIYLYGANHNAFNEAILHQDEGKDWYKGEKIKINPYNQRNFLKRYVNVFISSIINDGDLNLDNEYLYNKFKDYDLIVNNFKSGLNIYNAENNTKYLSNAKVKKVISSYDSNINTAGLFYHPGDREYLDLLNIRWEDKNQFIEFDINNNIIDKDFISLYLTQDSTDIINNKSNQSFSIVLKDIDNNEIKVILDENTPALKYQDGHPIFDKTSFSTHTPLSMVQIPLESIKDIDINNIKSIKILFDQKDKGSIMLRRIDII